MLQDYGEPWQVLPTAKVGYQEKKNVMASRDGKPIMSTGEETKRIRSRIVTCVNFLQGIPDAALYRQPSGMDRLMLAVLANPHSDDPKFMLLDELQEHFDSVKENRVYVPRSELQMLLTVLLHWVKENNTNYTIQHNTFFKRALEAVGVTCKAIYTSRDGRVYFCHKGKITLGELDHWGSMECQTCYGTGKMIPPKVPDNTPIDDRDEEEPTNVDIGGES